MLAGSDSPKITGYEEVGTEEKRPPSPLEHEFLVARSVQSGIPYAPASSGRVQTRRKRKTSLAMGVLILCVIGLASSTAYLTYFAYLSPESIPKLKEREKKLLTDVAVLRAGKEKATSLAKWLEASQIECGDSYFPKRPTIKIGFADLGDLSYNISSNDWTVHKMKVTWSIKNRNSGISAISEKEVSETDLKNILTIDLNSGGNAEKFVAGWYTLVLNAKIGDPPPVRSISRDFGIRMDESPPKITLLEPKSGILPNEEITVRVNVVDSESPLPPEGGLVKITYLVVWNETVSFYKRRVAMDSIPGTTQWRYDLWKADFGGYDLKKAKVIVFFIEASNTAEPQLTAYSETVVIAASGFAVAHAV